jgi:hypothetical protein
VNIEAIDSEAKWLLDKLVNAYRDKSEADRNYYQGRVDQLAWVKGQLLRDNTHNNCSYCAAGEAYNHNPEEVNA